MVALRSRFLPKGYLLHTPGDEATYTSRDDLRRAMEEEMVLEGVAQLCDRAHNLLVSIGPLIGSLLRGEAALGIAKGTTREIAILSQVGKLVCFQITALEESEGVLRPRLSRRRVQQAALDAMPARLYPDCILPAVVARLESFGVFVDIGCGAPSLIGIENIFVSHTPHPNQRFRMGQVIFAVAQELDPKLGWVYLTYRELLDTQVEDTIRFRAGMTVPGIVRGLKEHEAFVKLTPNLSGLAERKSGLREGNRVSVYIRTVLSERIKIKLLTIDTLPPLNVPASLEYFSTQGQVERWKYAPEDYVKVGAEAMLT